MISQFPKFDPITISAKQDINNIVSKLPPYSDFNFVSLHSWDIRDSMKVSILNDNLIVKFKDYESDKSFLSFIGESDIEKTVEAIINYSLSEGLGPRLHLIPEHVVTLIKHKDKFNIIEDRDNHDYIILALKYSELNGKKYDSKRNGIKRFNSTYLDRVRSVQLSIDEKTSEEILNVFYRWRESTGKSRHETAMELAALNKLLIHARMHNLDGVGVYIDDLMVGYSIYELTGDYAVGHFMKASREHIGLYDFLKHKTAVDIHNKGGKYINYEQDLGIEGLRKSKLLLHPETFLKKYTVELRSTG